MSFLDQLLLGATATKPFTVPKLKPTAIKSREIDLEGKKGIVLFYADWCGYCKRYKPDFQRLYDEFKDNKSVVIRAVHCPDNQRKCADFGITSYPTVVKVFPSGRVEPVTDRSPEVLSKWLRGQSGGARRKSPSRRSPRKAPRTPKRKSTRRRSPRSRK